MPFYQDHIYPQLVARLGDPPPIQKIRRRLIPLAQGMVLESSVPNPLSEVVVILLVGHCEFASAIGEFGIAPSNLTHSRLHGIFDSGSW
jgi:hypothetical protein